MPAVLLAIALSTLAAEASWRPLFNGRDLAGWKSTGTPEAFAVQDGVLRVQAVTQPEHLFFVGADPAKPERFRDFDLEVVARAEPDSNSGVFFHTGEGFRPGGRYLARGYEVQLNTQAKEKRKTGSLYAVVDVLTSPVDETKWFTVRVGVRGQRITVDVNGERTVDYTEPPGVKRPPDRASRLIAPEGGLIALQAHDSKSVWYFRSVRVRPTPAK